MNLLSTSRTLGIGVFVLLLTAYPISAQRTWTDASGNIHTEAELANILGQNQRWEHSKHKSGRRAVLKGARLHGFNWEDEDLKGADLEDADLEGAYLSGADLRGANLHGTNLKRANLERADLRGQDLIGTDLEGADLQFADLEKADLGSMSLVGVDLENADLSGAFLPGSEMQGANLRGAHLKGASLYYTDLDRVVFEPASLPEEARGIASARNLELLTYGDNPDALVQVRKQFVDGGFRQQERMITYALKRREAELSWDSCTSRRPDIENKRPALIWSSESNLANCASFVLNRVFFDLTCQYGMSPGRPLSVGVSLWLLCSFLYFACVRAGGGKGELYRVYTQSIQKDPTAHWHVEKVSPPTIPRTQGVQWFLRFLGGEWAVLRTSMFFSLMSAFNIGFRDINFGRWLRLLTRREFDIKALGWARVVSGWQSLISVYLIALWVLTFFGRPFG